MGKKARISELVSFIASSSTRRMMARAEDSTSRIEPSPLQRGQTIPLVSPNDGRKR